MENQLKSLVLYDGQCPLCQASIAWLKRLDWLRKIDCRDARVSENIPNLDPPLKPERLLEEMHLVTPRQMVYHGFKAFRYMAWRMPLLFPFAPFFYLPGVPWLGQKIYLWVARNRFNLVPCKDGACEIPRKK